ncbi:hypothetical protein BT63DRAFT_452494 [Microthyrium microscopicum]|uniref:Uncharacterized protein n=1 Tax=Microthyrium microscopicum TaxID=703497 RepID=A0A6A6UKJ4_9PEZI|nr:hypothetical protein BT63DRAFT_452494 [Microthyrium microscopicum]
MPSPWHSPAKIYTRKLFYNATSVPVQTDIWCVVVVVLAVKRAPLMVMSQLKSGRLLMDLGKNDYQKLELLDRLNPIPDARQLLDRHLYGPEYGISGFEVSPISIWKMIKEGGCWSRTPAGSVNTNKIHYDIMDFEHVPNGNELHIHIVRQSWYIIHQPVARLLAVSLAVVTIRGSRLGESSGVLFVSALKTPNVVQEGQTQVDRMWFLSSPPCFHGS